MQKHRRDRLVPSDDPALRATNASVRPRLAPAREVAPKAPDDERDAPSRTAPTGHIGWVVAASLGTGLLVGLLLQRVASAKDDADALASEIAAAAPSTARTPNARMPVA